MARARWDKPQPTREADADTLRQRALDDRRGTLYAEVAIPVEDDARELFTLRWSVTGRCDQVDIFHAGRIVRTIRPSAALRAIAELCARTTTCQF